MVAALDSLYQAALDKGRGVLQDRSPGCAGVERLAGDRVALALGRFEESEGEPLLTLAEDVQGEGAGLLDEPVAVRVDLHAHGDERGLEGGLGDPVDGGRGHLAVRPLGGQDVEAVGNHPQGGLSGVRIHDVGSRGEVAGARRRRACAGSTRRAPGEGTIAPANRDGQAAVGRWRLARRSSAGPPERWRGC
jgi:hypothetical protein